MRKPGIPRVHFQNELEMKISSRVTFSPTQIVELARNPKGSGADRRYRQAMMKSVGTERKLSEGEHETHREQLVRTEQDNQVWRKMLEDVRAYFLV